MRKRKTNWRQIATYAGVALAIFLTLGVILAGRDLPPPPGQQPIILQGGNVAAHRITTRSWSFTYDRAQTSPDGTVASVDGIHSGVLYKNGKPYLSISAQHITANTQTFDFTATGDVHIEYIGDKGKKRRSFDTDLVIWANALRQLQLNHPSIVRTGDNTLGVKSVLVDFHTGTVHLGPVKGKITI